MPKKRKLPPSKCDMCYRAGEVSIDGTTDADGIPLILATESPVRMWDHSERAIMGEVLRMDGLELPRQLPLLNSHNRDRARDVIGSIRDLTRKGDQLRGVAYFASNDEAQSVRQLYVEGHLTDFSIGFEPTQVQRVRSGETKTISGKDYSGPTRVVTSAKVREGSAVPIGADENAKALLDAPALRAYVCPEEFMEEYQMSQLRDFCLKRGMPADIEDDGIEQWMEENLDVRQEAEPEEPDPVDEVTRGQAIEAERKRCAKIAHFCGLHGISQQQQASYTASSLTAEQVSEDILEKIAKRRAGEKSTGPTITPMESEADKFLEGAKGALINRCLVGVNVDRAEKHARGEYEVNGTPVHTNARQQCAIEGVQEVKRLIESPVTRDFRNVGLCEMARMFVEQSGTRTWGMSKHDVVREAFRLDLMTRDAAAYHTTGSFTNVLLDAANKTLLMAFSEAEVTYPLWVRQAPSTTDFKTINRIRLGEIPDPSIVPENSPYGEVAVSDNKESYTPDKYGHIFSISLEAIVNDDLNAISRIPAQQGYAMRRKINKVCYSVLTANAALSDGVALFHGSSHGENLDATALSVAALNTGFTVMMKQTGISSDVTLNVTPRFLIVPAALAATAYQITRSVADPSNTAGSTEDAERPNYNSGVQNLYGPNGPRPLMPVVDAVLDGTSATGWYLAAEPNQIDTVELTFLQGEETPYLARQDEFTVDAVRYKIRQTFGAKAIDYRGLYQGNS